MTLIVEPHMTLSKHRTPFEAICQFRVKLKINLSFRQIGTLFKIPTSEQSIRRLVEDTFHAVTNYLNDVLVCSNLGLNHLIRIEALTHHVCIYKNFLWQSVVYYLRRYIHLLQQIGRSYTRRRLLFRT